jgi:hypothetical protein
MESSQTVAEVETKRVRQKIAFAPGFVLCCYALLFVSIALFAAIRFHLRHIPLDRDDGEYAYMGQLILDGVPPYTVAANMKLPGTYAAYAVLMAIFGQTTAGIHMSVIVVTSLSAIFLFLIGKRLYGLLTGAVAAASYIFFAAKPVVLGIDGQATHFVVVMALAGMWLLLCAMPPNRESADPEDSRHQVRLGLLFAAGLCFGLSFLMKQPGILFGFFAAIYWFFCNRKLPRKTLAAGGAALIVGTLIPYGITSLIMLKVGVFGKFWFWTWTYARQYAGLTDVRWGWIHLRVMFPWVVRPLPLWAFAVVGLLSPLWCSRTRPHAGFLSGFLVTSFVAVCPGLYFHPHYWIVFLPAGALAIGVGLESIRDDLLQSKFRRWASIPLIYFVLIYVTAVYGQWKAFYRLDPVALSRKMYPGSNFQEEVKIADFIKSRAHDGDRIGIFGNEPEICFYTHLRCATTNMYIYPMLEKQRYAKQMQREMERELESAPPRFFVYIDSWYRILTPNHVDDRAFMNWGWDFAHRGYKLVYQIRPTDDRGLSQPLYGASVSLNVFERIDQ